MADRIKFGVSLTPLETLTDENGGTRDIIASEIGKSLSASGESVALTDYSGAVANQGYKDAAVGYRSAAHTGGGTALSGSTDPVFIFIKNTGYKYSTATSLGAPTTDCIIVALQLAAHDPGNAGGWENSSDAPQVYYVGIAFLKPGQGIILPMGHDALTQFNVAGDYCNLCPSNGGDGGVVRIHVKTVLSNVGAASAPNAVEFLMVI